jgi:hypothetical protein
MRYALLIACLLLAGCGGEAGDLMSIDVSGGPTNAKHTIVVSGDGRGSCDKSKLRALPSARVITAREVEREARKLARAGTHYPERAGRRRFALSTNDGIVRWSEGTPGLPKDLPRAQLLALQLERRLCPS